MTEANIDNFQHGIYIDTIKKLDEFMELYRNSDSGEVYDLLLDGSLLNDGNFVKYFQSLKIKNSVNVAIRELVPSHMIQIISKQKLQMQLEFLNEVEKNFEKAKAVNCSKIIHSIDILPPNNNEKELFSSLYGMSYAKGIEFILALRIPMPENNQNFLQVHEMLRKSMCHINLALDIHVDENGFMQMNFAEAIKPLLFDIDMVHFLCESQFGNRLEISTLQEVSQVCSQFNPNVKVFF